MSLSLLSDDVAKVRQNKDSHNRINKAFYIPFLWYSYGFRNKYIYNKVYFQ